MCVRRRNKGTQRGVCVCLLAATCVHVYSSRHLCPLEVEWAEKLVSILWIYFFWLTFCRVLLSEVPDGLLVSEGIWENLQVFPGVWDPRMSGSVWEKVVKLRMRERKSKGECCLQRCKIYRYPSPVTVSKHKIYFCAEQVLRDSKRADVVEDTGMWPLCPTRSSKLLIFIFAPILFREQLSFGSYFSRIFARYALCWLSQNIGV